MKYDGNMAIRINFLICLILFCSHTFAFVCTTNEENTKRVLKREIMQDMPTIEHWCDEVTKTWNVVRDKDQCWWSGNNIEIKQGADTTSLVSVKVCQWDGIKTCKTRPLADIIQEIVQAGSAADKSNQSMAHVFDCDRDETKACAERNALFRYFDKTKRAKVAKIITGVCLDASSATASMATATSSAAASMATATSTALTPATATAPPDVTPLVAGRPSHSEYQLAPTFKQLMRDGVFLDFLDLSYRMGSHEHQPGIEALRPLLPDDFDYSAHTNSAVRAFTGGFDNPDQPGEALADLPNKLKRDGWEILGVLNAINGAKDCLVLKLCLPGGVDPNAAFVAFNERLNDVIIVFRGSNSSGDVGTNYSTGDQAPSLSDILNDGANGTPNNVQTYNGFSISGKSFLFLHKGIALKYASMKEQLHSILITKFPNIRSENFGARKIYVIGHSQGGALAEIGAMDLASWINFSQNKYSIRVWALSGPEVFSYGLARVYNAFLGMNTIRQNTEGDLVPVGMKAAGFFTRAADVISGGLALLTPFITIIPSLTLFAVNEVFVKGGSWLSLGYSPGLEARNTHGHADVGLLAFQHKVPTLNSTVNKLKRLKEMYKTDSTKSAIIDQKIAALQSPGFFLNLWNSIRDLIPLSSDLDISGFTHFSNYKPVKNESYFDKDLVSKETETLLQQGWFHLIRRNQEILYNQDPVLHQTLAQLDSADERYVNDQQKIKDCVVNKDDSRPSWTFLDMCFEPVKLTGVGLAEAGKGAGYCLKVAWDAIVSCALSERFRSWTAIEARRYEAAEMRLFNSRLERGVVVWRPTRAAVSHPTWSKGRPVTSALLETVEDDSDIAALRSTQDAASRITKGRAQAGKPSLGYHAPKK